MPSQLRLLFAGPEPQVHLIKLLHQARVWWQEMCTDGLSATQLGERHGINKSYVSRVVRVNFLAPRIVDAILAGNQPASLDARGLLGLHMLPLKWEAQAEQLRFN